MKILTRHTLKEYLRLLIIIIMVLGAVYSLILFLDTLDNALENKAPLKTVVTYLFYYQPQVVKDTLPLAFFFAAITYLIIASKNFELVALRALGIRAYKALTPILILAGLASTGLIFWNLQMVPLNLTKAALIKKVEIYKNKQALFTRYTDIWAKQQNVSCFIHFFDERKMRFRKVRCVWVEKGHLEAFATSDTVIWQGEGWQMLRPILLTARENGLEEERPESLPFPLDLTPQGLLEEKKESWEMAYQELKDYIHAMKEEGYKVPHLEMELYQRVATALSPFVLVLLVFPLALRPPREGGWKMIITTVGALALYWGTVSLLALFGRGGWLPPLVASFLPPVAASSVAIGLIKKKER